MTEKYALAKGISMNEIEGKTVLFSIKTGDSWGLNETGAVLVRHLLDADVEATVAKYAEVFEVAPEVIEADLRELITELSHQGLLIRQ